MTLSIRRELGAYRKEESGEKSQWQFNSALKKEKQKISNMAQKYNVPYWMAEVYRYYRHQTENFLFRRKTRTNEKMDWRKLYELIGKIGISVGIDMGTMLMLLDLVATKMQEKNPFEAELECGYVGAMKFRKIEEICEKYIKTEFPNLEQLEIKISPKTEIVIVGTITIGAGNGIGPNTAPVYKTIEKLHIKVKYS